MTNIAITLERVAERLLPNLKDVEIRAATVSATGRLVLDVACPHLPKGAVTLDIRTDVSGQEFIARAIACEDRPEVATGPIAATADDGEGAPSSGVLLAPPYQ